MGVVEGYRAGSEAYERRQSRREAAAIRNQELEKQGYSFKNGEMSIREGSAAHAAELASQEAVARSKATSAELARIGTANALEEFAYDGDATYLNRDINSSPEKKAAWAQKGVHMVENINFENDTDMLGKAGFQTTAYDTPEKQSIIKKSVYKIFDGHNWSIGLANKAMMETGSGRVLGKRRSQAIRDNHRALVNLLGGPRSSPYTAEGHKYEKQIKAASEKYDVPPNLITAIMSQESSNNPNAVSPKGASGLMQLMPETAKEMGVTDVYDVAQNIDGGVKYFKKQLDRYKGDVNLALAAYNAGASNVDKYGGIPPFSETQNYVKKVTSALNEAESFYGNSAEDIYNAMLYPEPKAPTSDYEAFKQIDRETFAASQGKTASQIYRETEADIANRRAAGISSITAAQEAPRKLAQKDRELDIKEATMLNKAKELSQELKKPSTKRKELTEAEEVESSIYEKFGGFDKFMSADMDSNSDDYANTYSQMLNMEKLQGTSPSEGQQKRMSDLRVMATLFKDAASLTKDQTGLVDTTLKGIKEYIDDNMTEGKASSAYHSIRNLYIHSLAGSAQSKAEVARLTKAFGNDTKKIGPVLTQLSTVLTQKMSAMDSAMRDMHPVSAKVRLGIDMKKMENTRNNMQASLDYIEARAKFIAGKGADPDARPPLTSFEK